MRDAPRRATPRRSLVLTSEFARHPFRASLPAHVHTVPADPVPAPRRLSRRDWRDILGAYVASFLVISIFIA